MFANFLIGLREGLEATLVVSILIAYLVRMERRDQLAPIWLGVGVAVLLSIGFGAILTFTSSQLTFEQQEVFGGIASIIAVAFVTGMIFWMRRQARHMRRDLDGKMAAALHVGAGALAATAFIAVVREGLETALFFWSAAQASSSTAQPLIGFLLGIGTAITLGWMLYRRAITMNLHRFFTWTGAALIVVAAGVLSYGVHDLQEAGVLPGLTNLAFDVSAQVPADSWYGTLLKGIFNFQPETTVLQAAVWTIYVVVVLSFFLRGNGLIARLRGSSAQAGTVAAVLLIFVAGGCGGKKQTDGEIEVTATDNACTTETKAVKAGMYKVEASNEGKKVNEVYVYGAGSAIVAEVEDLAPGLKRDFTVDLKPGSYEIACKPGMKGAGIRTPLKVTAAP